MTPDDLGPMPEPEIEPGEPNPGGPDALPQNGDHAVPELPPEDNPAVEDRLPDDLLGTEDTSTKATRDEEHDEDEESPA